MRARRFKHLTQKELAKEIGEPEILVKLAEEGKISTKNERFVDKLESYLNIKLKKSQTESLLGNLNDGDFSFDPVSNKKTTISDLKKMGEAQSKKEEVSQIKEEKRGFFSRKDNSSLIKKEEPNKPLIKEVKPIERKDDFLQLKKEEISRPIIKEIKPMERREIPSNRVGGMIPSLRNIANNPVPKTSVVQTPSKKEELTENKKPLKEDDDKPLTQEDIDRILYGRDFD